MPRPSTKTPMMQQYLKWKERYADAILMFRMGDFFEMFFEDAVEVARVCDLTLTTRDKKQEDPIPMCGVPHHTLNTYVARLVDKGYKVAVCDQVEDPKYARGIVKREVTRVVTPGVILDMDQLDARSANYLMAVWSPPPDPDRTPETPDARDTVERYGVAFADVSTGEFRLTEVDGLDGLTDELARIGPRQVLVTAAGQRAFKRVFSALSINTVEEVAETLFGPEPEPPIQAVARITGTEPARLEHLPEPALPAAAAVARYLESTVPGGTVPPLRAVPYSASGFMVLDEATLANLEVFHTLMEGKREGSLLWAVDETVTAMGGRALRQALAFPLQDLEEIARRHDAIEALLDAPSVRTGLRKTLAQIHDLMRLGRRISHEVAAPRDLSALRRSLELMPELEAILAGLRPETEKLHPGLNLELAELGTDLLQDVAGEIAAAVVDEPPATLKDGGVMRPGYNEELDRLTEVSRGGKDNILAIEKRERKRTGIHSLKVKYNRVFGYYIEVTRANLSQVPEDYTRKQTLANAERFVTAELAEYEALVLNAEEHRIELEERLFTEFRRSVAEKAERLARLADRIALIDLLAGFAECAAKWDYVRPEVNSEGRLEILEGRHPVVERFREPGTFVPNDTLLDNDSQLILIVTGPNMAGKSTIIRQVALIALLAHTGSYVPAKKAAVGLTDRIFTRVGASDNLARGESTFMVEMKETANILKYATTRSLVILDEIGRGTATFDGMSIAWAVAEFLHDKISCRTMFATHYHELCSMADLKPRVKNYTVMVREWQEDIVFVHKLVPGSSNRSYGIQVARLAGLPDKIIERSRQILNGLEEGSGPPSSRVGPRQMGLFTAPPPAKPGLKEPEPHQEISPVEKMVLESAPDDMSPRQALELLFKLRSLMKKPKDP